MAYSDAADIIRARGPAISKADLRDIEIELVGLTMDEYHEATAWISEAVRLIVTGPDYGGDLTLKDLKG